MSELRLLPRVQLHRRDHLTPSLALSLLVRTLGPGSFEDSSHSGSARKMMAKYQIGVVEPGAAGSAAAASTATATASKAKGGGGASSYLVYAVPVLILLGALYFQFVQPPAKA